jgi:hypothetical protein
LAWTAHREAPFVGQLWLVLSEWRLREVETKLRVHMEQPEAGTQGPSGVEGGSGVEGVV